MSQRVAAQRQTTFSGWRGGQHPHWEWQKVSLSARQTDSSFFIGNISRASGSFSAARTKWDCCCSVSAGDGEDRYVASGSSCWECCFSILFAVGTGYSAHYLQNPRWLSHQSCVFRGFSGVSKALLTTCASFLQVLSKMLVSLRVADYTEVSTFVVINISRQACWFSEMCGWLLL